jgi:mannose-6-phosphate isomerase-like protein (cupin superfamily)
MPVLLNHQAIAGTTMLEHIKHNEELLAIIVHNDFASNGIRFFTPDEFSQQLAFMRHPKGKLIEPHMHNIVPRSITYTQEVLIIRRGRLRVDFYDCDQSYLQSRILTAGDIILLAAGGHGFEILDDLEMIEVKQGPYTGEGDKTRFPASHGNTFVLPDDDRE